MMNMIMNILSPSMGGEISKTDFSTSNNTSSTGSDFSQILSILMAQMGLCAVIPFQSSGIVVLDKEGEREIQSESSPSVVLHQINEGIMTNEQSVEGSNNVEEGTITTNSTSDLNTVSPYVSETNFAVNNEETTNLILSVIGMEGGVSGTDEIHKELSSQSGVDFIVKQLSSAEQTKMSSTDEKIINLISEGKPLMGNIQLQSSGDNICMIGNKNSGLNSILEKLHVKGIELSTILPTEKPEEVNITKSGPILQDSNSPQNLGSVETNVQNEYVELLKDIKQDLSKSGEMKARENIIPKIVEAEVVSSLGNRNSKNTEQKLDMKGTNNPQLDISPVKSVKTGNEEISSIKSIPISSPETREVVATLSSLRSVVSEQIKFAVRSEIKTIIVKLEPESLGAMEIKVQEHSGKIGIQLTTSNNEVHKILSQGLPQLREVLKQEGIFVKDMQVISAGTTNLMLNQGFSSQSFSKEIQIESVLYHRNADMHQVTEEIKPPSVYHDGTLSLWV